MKKSYPTYLQAIGLVLLQLPVGVALMLVMMPLTDIDNVIVSTLLSILIILIVVVIGLNFRNDFTFSYARFPVVMLIVAFVLIMSLNVVIDPFISLIPVPDFLREAFTDMEKYPLLLFFAVVVSAPVLEEILLRGIILDGFLKNYSPFNSVMVSALLFGIMHLNFQQGIGAFLMGVIVGFLYWRTRSIILCMSLHGLNNLFAFVSMLLLDENESNMNLQEYVGDNPMFYLIYAASVLVSLACGWFLWTRYLKPVQALIHLEPVEEPTEDPKV